MMSIEHLANEVRMACQQVSRRVRFEAGSQIPPHQASVLFKLQDGPRTPGELADAERIAPPSMTKTVSCLAEKGLVTRDDNPSDGRSKLVALTDAGRAAIDEVVRVRDDWMVHKLEGLSEAELDLLERATELLNRVVAK
ncbi:MarR family winged helix-turn-helix transcriptional regulator [Propionicimonas sp.]|uniref:MarR family winged helix-turn-helix transcriptional regulator n=1 Tax=Propionicimonas sp. TaxID=1955623 RepID=UPI0039E3FB19